MTGQQRVCGWCCLLVIVYVSSQLVHVADAQAYHFSKGWMPGRKRSEARLMGESEPGQKSSVFGELDRRSAADICAVKSQAYQLALDVLKARVCSYFEPSLGTDASMGVDFVVPEWLEPLNILARQRLWMQPSGSIVFQNVSN